ncbi:MAG: Nif11-like leader peptide family natural product precursor [Actinobacteria bacterium]|nr:MAG: Nif11-like leader peptide family natural product precursor [Actinomycetota bacterium]
MSVSADGLRELLERAQADGALMVKLQAAETRSDVVAVARAQGLDVHLDDLRPEADEEALEVELSDQELEGSAGGYYTIPETAWGCATQAGCTRFVICW